MRLGISLSEIPMKNIYVLIFFISFSTAGYSQNVDINLLKHIHSNRYEKLDPTLELITNSVTPLSIAVPVGTATYALITKDDQSLQDAMEISSTVLVSGLLSVGLKYAINRERPFDTYPFITAATHADTPSFPSGHTTHAFALATSVSLVYQDWYIVVPSYLWAGAVGYTRMALGVHYPSDVLAGALIGSGSAYLCHKINQKITEKNGGIRFSSSMIGSEHVQLSLIIPLD
jgi:membrane-associated phospholipid phosphatase